MIKLTVTGRFTEKDQRKANKATRFIGRGSPRSSTNQYAKDFGPLANCGSYKQEHTVFISAEGNRSERIKPDLPEIKLAIKARSTFVTDDKDNRNRPYNIGEREVAEFLIQNGYRETEPGYWEPPV